MKQKQPKKRKTKMTQDELKLRKNFNGIKVQQKYQKEDYMFTSFTMPYEYKNKLDRLSKKHGMTRSAFFRLLLDRVNE